jgi:hypothetical protein
MEGQSYRAILWRVGLALVVVGCVDIASMVYCIVHRMSYRSSLNLFAVIAGILLMRGSLRTATAVRWFGMFFFSAGVAMLLLWETLQPVSLTLTEFRLAPARFTGLAALMLSLLAFFYWGIRELGRNEVQLASLAARVRSRNMRFPAVLGVALVVALIVTLNVFINGETGHRMEMMAEKQVGSGYKFHVTSLSVSNPGPNESVSGVVTAWNDSEIRDIPIHWGGSH